MTGASRFPGGFLVSRLVQDPSIERVVAVDAVSPSKDMMRRMGRAEFVRADIRNSLIGKVIRGAEVDTVVHAANRRAGPAVGQSRSHEGHERHRRHAVFAVCQKSPSVRKVVLRSASAVYGRSPGDPAKFTEEMGARRPPRGALGRDCIDIEGYARAMGRRRPDIAVSILRLAPLMGPHRHGWVARYLSSPIVPRILGRDARMQLLHEEDALAALHRATVTGPPARSTSPVTGSS
ncbi:NAD-dependent epimerase/dehydratase family protein [Rhodococcus hoagii]|nr:NAD-dependent epimerase/dehydratase family protein [Prescottella equi]